MNLRNVGSPVLFCVGWLVVPGGVEGEVAEDLAGGGVDDGDGEVLDEHGDVGSGVGSSDSDVVEASGVAEGDDPGCVDCVVSDPVVGVGCRVGCWGGFGQAGVAGYGWLVVG